MRAGTGQDVVACQGQRVLLCVDMTGVDATWAVVRPNAEACWRTHARAMSAAAPLLAALR